MKQREVCEFLAVKPTPGEVRQALTKLKNGKAAGSSGILPEMLKAGKRNDDFVLIWWAPSGKSILSHKSG